MDMKRYTATVKEIKDEGVVEGVFATLNAIDLDGDVTMPGAFGNQKVKIAAWGHNWGTLPVGRGDISEDGDDAVFASQFFMDTTDGKEHFLTVKNLDELQEWSYGFEVREAVLRGSPGFDELLAQVGMSDNAGVQRFLLKLNVFEVSPVMRGAGVGTHTTVAKSNLPFGEHGKQVLTEVTTFIERSKARRDHRATEDRTLSQADRDELAGLMKLARDVADDIKELLTEPVEASGLGLLIQRALNDAEKVRV